jgi:hypothetical protein
MTDISAGVACLERELETLQMNYYAAVDREASFDDPQQELRRRTMEGISAALVRLQDAFREEAVTNQIVALGEFMLNEFDCQPIEGEPFVVMAKNMLVRQRDEIEELKAKEASDFGARLGRLESILIRPPLATLRPFDAKGCPVDEG